MKRSDHAGAFTTQALNPTVAWCRSDVLVDYEAAVGAMERRVEAIAAGRATECVWLLEHPPIYTGGTSAKAPDLAVARFPTFHSGRGGQYTYHGPGQRVAYVMLDLKRRKPDVRAFVVALEDWVIATLTPFGVTGERREDRVGVWVRRSHGPGEDKIAALGIRLRHWVSFHGIAINVAPDLSHYSGIVPCGIGDPAFGVTSLAALGVAAGMRDVDTALRAAFERLFGPTADAPSPGLESRAVG